MPFSLFVVFVSFFFLRGPDDEAAAAAADADGGAVDGAGQACLQPGLRRRQSGEFLFFLFRPPILKCFRCQMLSMARYQ